MSSNPCSIAPPPPAPPDSVQSYNLTEVLRREAKEIDDRVAKANAEGDPGVVANLAFHPPRCKDDQRPDRFAVAFSGGGIRSACVSLGIAQSLAKHRVLRQAHYLSAISGGGYFLGWLSAWISREKGGVGTYSGFREVERQLGDAPEKEHVHGAYNRYIEPNPIHHLRQYSSYLTPRLGLLSGDSLAMASIYIRNLLLNLTMFTAGLMTVMLVLQSATPTRMWNSPLGPCTLMFGVLGILGCFGLAVFWATRSIGQIRNGTYTQSVRSFRWPLAFGLLGCAITWRITPTFYTYPDPYANAVALTGGLALLGLALARFFPKATVVKPINQVSALVLALAWFTAALVTFAVDMLFMHWLRTDTAVWVTPTYVILGLPLVWCAFPLVSYFFVGLLGDGLAEAEREWLARFAGYFLHISLGYALVMSIALKGPWLLHTLFQQMHHAGWHGLITALIPGGWLYVVVTGILGGKGHDATGTEGKKSWSGFIVAIAPPVFLLGALLLVSWGTTRILSRIERFGSTEGIPVSESIAAAAQSTQSQPAAGQNSVAAQPYTLRLLDSSVPYPLRHRNRCDLYQVWQHGSFSAIPHGMADCASVAWRDLASAAWSTPGAPATAFHNILGDPAIARYVALIFIFAVIAGVLGWRLDVNEFSMHLFYRNRLVRAFLGASVEGRAKQVNKFTGFSSEDDVPLSNLIVEKGFTGPYPLWGTTLNITKGEDLGWQQRKGASFLYSPLSCGWDYVEPTHAPPSIEPPTLCPDTPAPTATSDSLSRFGYRSTRYYSGDQDGAGRSLVGTAMAASGAAASPNMGYHTRPGVAALLAIFNVRLGWWAGNPRDNNGWKQYSPSISYLLKELLGATDDKSRYVYLSDGGHFENLGLYELIRRRVRFIISSDAAADAEFGFGDLGNAIERCRRDFGVEIHLTAQSSMDLADDPPFRSAHYALGEIDYGDFKGILLYLKSSLTDDEPGDVLSFQDADKAFPHDSTANQFFTESMFEAYRALGQHMMDKVFDTCGITANGDAEPRAVVSRLYEKLSCLQQKAAQDRAPSPRSSSLSSIASTLKQLASRAPVRAKDLNS